MPRFGEVQVKFNHIPEILRRAPERADALVRAIAFAIEAEAKRGAPVDTGFLKSSIYTDTSRSSGYDAAVREAQGRLFGEEHREVFPPLPRPKRGEALVAVAAEYGIYLEFGTTRMAARPYLRPAIDRVISRVNEIARREMNEGALLGKAGG